MDLNDLLHGHQLAHMRATHARSAETARAHRATARGYADRIALARQQLGANGRMVLA